VPVFPHNKQYERRVLVIIPSFTVEAVLTEMDFAPVIVGLPEKLPPPNKQQLSTLRTEIDPGGRVLEKDKWIRFKPEG